MRKQSDNLAYNHLQITQKIRSLGREMSPVTMAAMGLFIPFHETPPYEGVRIERDIAYGTDPRNLLDLCASGTLRSGDRRDVLIFLHGGGFVRGDKRVPDSPYHDNVALWAARNGMMGVNMTYRLAPEHRYPSGIEDVAAVVQWLQQNAESYGGDADRIFLFGSSAGAIHIACYLASLDIDDSAPVAGVVLQSGAYDLAAFSGEGNVGTYFGSDASRYAEISPQPTLVNGKTPAFYVFTEFDTALIEKDNLSLINSYVARWNRVPHFIRLIGHNHFTAVASLNTPDTYLGDAILAFIDGTRDKSKV